MKFVDGVKSRSRRSRLLLLALAVVAVGLAIAALFLDRRPASTPSARNEPAPEVIRTVEYKADIVFLGDTMLARVVGPAILRGEDPFEYVRPTLDTYDMRVANIESVIADPAIATTPANKRYTYNAPLGVLKAIKGMPVDVSILANNHIGDFGRQAILNTMANFDDAGLVYTGVGKDIEGAFKPLVIDIELKADDAAAPPVSLKIGVIGYNDFENVFTDAKTGVPGAAFFDKDRLAASIKSAKDQGAELVFVVPHWGAEFQLNRYTPRQQESGRWLIKAGADAVIGGHPHVIQPTETYRGKPIVYSIGNFVFSGMESIANTGRGQMVGFDIASEVTLRDGQVDVHKPAVLSKPRYHFYNLDLKGYPHPE